jgi:hypothetical protein
MATHQEYLNKMHAHTACAKHTLSLDKMLGGKKVLLNKKERNLDLREPALMEVQGQGLNHQDNCDELTEHVRLGRCLEEVEVERVTEAGWLAVLMGTSLRS